MKRLLSWCSVLLTLIVVIGASVYFLVIPGVKNLNDSADIKVLTSEEVAEIKAEIAQKYVVKNQELDQKYLDLQNDLKEEYNKKMIELKSKYTKKMSDAGWFDEQSKLSEEKYKLELEKAEKSSALSSQKSTEWFALQKAEANETSAVDNNKTDKSNLFNSGLIKFVGGVIAIIVFVSIIISIVNRLVRSKNSVKESWAQIEVVLKRRYDLIPNIVSTIKGFTKHESEVLEKVTEIRTDALKTHDKEQEMKLNSDMTKQVNKMLLLSEDYPTLQSDKNYMMLQEELRNTEDLIAEARENYNNAVLQYKNVKETIPTNIFACMLNYQDELFFDIDDKEAENPTINFNDNNQKRKKDKTKS